MRELNRLAVKSRSLHRRKMKIFDRTGHSSTLMNSFKFVPTLSVSLTIKLRLAPCVNMKDEPSASTMAV